jgi:hypothetical protein
MKRLYTVRYGGCRCGDIDRAGRERPALQRFMGMLGCALNGGENTDREPKQSATNRRQDGVPSVRVYTNGWIHF